MMAAVHELRAAPRRDRFIALAEVEQLIGCKKSTIYNMLKDDKSDFPRPVRLGPRMVRWSEASVLQWIQDCISQAPATRRDSMQVSP